MIRATLVVLLLLGLAITQVASQPSTSNSPSPNSVSASNSNTWTPSNSGSNSNSNTWSPTTSGSTSNTVTPPPAPIDLANSCPGHITRVCPSWSNPSNTTYASFVVTFIQAGCATCVSTSFSTTSTSGLITNLMPSTSYTFTVAGITTAGLRSFESTAVTFTTDPTDPKLDPSKDIHDITCNSVLDATTERYVIQCNWSAAAETLTRLVIKWRCTSEIRKRNSNKKRLYGAKAQATSVTLRVNRDVATCAVFFRSYYTRRPANRHALTVIMGL